MTLQELLEDEREEAREEALKKRDKEIILKLYKAGMAEKTIHEMLDFPLEQIQGIIGQKEF